MNFLQLATTRRLVAASLAAVLLVLAGCGGSSTKKTDEESDDLSASELYSRAVEKMGESDGFSMVGSIEDPDDGLLDLDMTFMKDGDHFGSVGFDGVQVEMRIVEGVFFMNGADEFWEMIGEEDGDSPEAITAVIQLFGGRWITLPKSELGEFDDLSFDELMDELEVIGKVTRKDDKVVDGVDCFVLETQDEVLFVNKETGLPVRFDSKGDGSSALLNFDPEESPGAPDPDDVIDLADFA